MTTTTRARLRVPMSALCVNRETARRALFLLDFLNDAEGR